MISALYVEQLHKIFKLCGSPSEEYWRKSKLPHATIFKPQQPYRRCVADTFKDFPAQALELMETLLSIDPADRGSAASALHSEKHIIGGAAYGFLAPMFATFKADGTSDTVKQSFTFVRDFMDICYHSYFSVTDDLRSQGHQDGKYFEIRCRKML
ncbi:unnamed protein product [Camellia sinensis]